MSARLIESSISTPSKSGGASPPVSTYMAIFSLVLWMICGYAMVSICRFPEDDGWTCFCVAGYFQQVSHFELELSLSFLPDYMALFSVFITYANSRPHYKLITSASAEQSHLGYLFQDRDPSGGIFWSWNLSRKHGISVYLSCLYSND